MTHGINRTSLTAFAPMMRDEDPDGAHRFAAMAWHEMGMIVFRPESLKRMDIMDRELVEAIAARLYGRRDKD